MHRPVIWLTLFGNSLELFVDGVPTDPALLTQISPSVLGLHDPAEKDERYGDSGDAEPRDWRTIERVLGEGFVEKYANRVTAAVAAAVKDLEKEEEKKGEGDINDEVERKREFSGIEA